VSRQSAATTHKENTFFLRFGNPLATNLQAVTGQDFADAFRRVTIREEKPDGFATTELEAFVAHFDLPRAGETKLRDNALQIKTAVFNGKTRFAIAPFNAQIQQKCHQPVAGQVVVVLRQDFFQPGGAVLSRRKVRAEQQKIP
jgi:hypothetical protein